jgi:hypothetical protein
MRTEMTTPPAVLQERERERTRHREELLDKALADTFPASDPVSSLATDDPVPNTEDGTQRPGR